MQNTKTHKTYVKLKIRLLVGKTMQYDTIRDGIFTCAQQLMKGSVS